MHEFKSYNNISIPFLKKYYGFNDGTCDSTIKSKDIGSSNSFLI